ncbi:MAG: hypothetical protein AAFR81_10020 [Chloroflexota bacterium]
MNLADYYAFTQELTTNLQADPKILGLVLLGSTANQSRQPDAYSDHDFFVITESGSQEDYRTDLTWLPDYTTIVLNVRETAHGLKVLYKNGHLLEFAVFDTEEIALAKVNDYAIAFDKANVTEAITSIATSASPALTSNTLDKHHGMFLCLLVVGAGRVAREEIISGQLFIRANALSQLLQILAHTHPADDKSQLHNLDPFRRFEQVFPELGAQINAALLQDPITGALSLLAIYQQTQESHVHYRGEAVKTVRKFLQQIETG